MSRRTKRCRARGRFILWGTVTCDCRAGHRGPHHNRQAGLRWWGSA